MKVTCPKFMKTRLASISKLTEFHEETCVELFEQHDEKKPACKPDVDCWVVLIGLDSVASMLSRVVARLQGLATLLGEQETQLGGIFVTLCELCPVSGPHGESTLAQVGFNEQSHVIRGAYSAKLSDARLFLDDLISFVLNTLLNRLDAEQVQGIKRFIAKLFAGLVDASSHIFALRDDPNEAENAEDLPVTPTMLVKLRLADVSVLLNRYKARLSAANWSESSIDQIQRDNRALPNAYRNELVFEQTVDACKLERTFSAKCWVPAHDRFDAPRDFCGGLASVFPSTATIESDFSVIGREKIVYLIGPADFSLARIIQAKQFCRLLEL